MNPKEDVEQLMNEGFEFAAKVLREHGEFYPFGIVRKADGNIQHVGAADGTEHPPSAALIEILRSTYRQEAQAGRYSATAMFYDVRITPPGKSAKSDAIQVELEHSGGYCADVFFPYTRDSAGNVSFGEIFASKRDLTVFGRAS
jgi:hypothetical protein